jgi:hypothetical protein
MPSRAQFESMRLELLRGGVSPVYVERTIIELSEHYEDLVCDALDAGLSSEEAARIARTAIGNEQTLAAAVLARPELLSWSRRWPTLAYCVRSAAAIGVLPALPVLYCVDRGQFLARWCGALSGAIVIVGLLLAWLNWMIAVG